MSSQTTLTRFQVADILDETKADLLREWEAKSRARVAAAKEQSRLALRDSLPQFMDRMIYTLSCENPAEAKAENSKVAREHGEDRASQPEYTLSEVIFEYHILRSVIISGVEAKGLPDSESRRIIHEVIDRGIASSAARYHDLEKHHQNQHKVELESARLEADRATRAKTAFLANMSHEIRTPLGAIMGFVSLLKDNGLTDEETSRYLSVIDRNSNHLLRIIDDILDLTKVEAGKMIIEKVEFSLVEFLADFASLVGLKAQEKGIVFKFRPESFLPESIVTDPTRLRQILSNIVGNAIKFTDKGHVELIVSYKEPNLLIKVRDTGRGISAEQRLGLFQAFAQADASTTRKFGGTGLGLVLTKKLSQALGGDFDLVESQIGQGSTFQASVTVEIPAAAKLTPLKELKIAPNPQSPEPTATFGGLDILVVEDSPDNRFLIETMLKKTGIKITLAENGAEGVALALKHRFGVILMDIQMPVMDGHEAVKLLRENSYTGPIVALTAHAMKEERERAINSGFSHFLSKPIHRHSLLELLATLYKPLSK